MGPGVHDQSIDPEAIAPLELLQQTAAGSLQHLSIRGAQVDQVGGVGDHRRERAPVTGLAESLDFGFEQPPHRPLERVRYKDLNGQTSELLSTSDGVRDTARSRDMSPKRRLPHREFLSSVTARSLC
jgi:hypothetical protein